MNHKKYQISEIARLFHLPVSTLHYWEKAGLLTAKRGENQYRTYGWRDLFDIWEIDLYRRMQVPVRQLRGWFGKNQRQREDILGETEERLQREIREKQEQLTLLQNYRQSIGHWTALQQKNPREMPWMQGLIPDLFTPDSMKRTVANPANCCIYASGEPSFPPILCLPAEAGDTKLVWQRKQTGTYISGGIRLEVGHPEKNSMDSLRNKLQAQGYTTNEWVGQYLFSAWDGARYDYYQVWVRVE